jgi:HPt (histidine-containing phosphotransfer) domain-containing protein
MRWKAGADAQAISEANAVVRSDKPIDVDHLNRYTGGNRATNEEILLLFDDQCREILAKLAKVADYDAKSWHELTHSLKGAARWIGAMDLGDAAAAAEEAGPAAAGEVARLQREAAAVRDFIAGFLGTPG